MNKATSAMVGILVAIVVAVALSAQAADGKEVFLALKCDMCHAVPAAEIEAKVKVEKMKGPAITGPSSVDADQLAKYLRKQAQIDGKDHKSEFKGTDEELKAILAWFETLER